MGRLVGWLSTALLVGVLVVFAAIAVPRWHRARVTTASTGDSYPEPIPNGPPPALAARRDARAEVRPAVSLSGTPPTEEELRASVRGSNIVIVVMDAARSDHLGCYGYPRDTTPNIDRIARQAVVFEDHFCQYPCTSPSTVSLFTGQYPDTHGVKPPSGHAALLAAHPVDERAVTMEGLLRANGYWTCLFSGNPAASPAVGVGTDFQLAFPAYGKHPQKQWTQAAHHRSDSVKMLLDAIGDALAAAGGEHRFFFYIHFLPPHSPYRAPEEFQSLFRGKTPPNHREGKAAFTLVSTRERTAQPPKSTDEWVNLYDANLRWADWGVGEVERMLKERGLWEQTLVIVTADHGEAMREHGYEWHHTCPYDEAIHIPLLIKFPGGRGPVGRISALTETVDIMPTIADLYGLKYPSDGPLGTVPQGKSLVPLLTGAATRVRDYVFSRTGGHWACSVVRNHEWSLLLYTGGKLRALYDLGSDPGQTYNALADHPKVAETMAAAFESHAKAQRVPPLEFLDPNYRPPAETQGQGESLSGETKSKLRALGYLD